MFVAPLLLPTATPRASARMPAADAPRSPVFAVVAWLVIGAVAIVSIPALRGDPALGATVPFWLVAAPAIDLAWLARARIGAVIRRIARTARRRPSQAKRLQCARRARRSSM